MAADAQFAYPASAPSLEEPAPSDEAPAQNPFVRTASDPFSTFAADVDTASYDLFRSRLSNLGELPDANTVRTEEFINSFVYDYPAPSTQERHPFRIDLAAAPSYLGAPRALLRVGIQAIEPERFEKKPTNLAFLVDVSGSMQDSLKLPLVKKLLTETLAVLDPEDQVAIVTYASGTAVPLPSTSAASPAVGQAIAALEPSGATNGQAGLGLAYQQVADNYVEGGINHVVLSTDGDFNVGPASTEELVRWIERERNSGITFTGVGFGTDLNDAMLEAISNKGNGIYGIVGSIDDAVDYAHDRMLASLQLVAKDLKIQVEFNPERVAAYRLIGYENRALADEEFFDDTIDAGEVGAGHRVTALYELALDEDALPEGAVLSSGEPSDLTREVAASDLVQVKVRYKSLDAQGEDPSFEVVESLAAEALAKPDPELEWAGAVAAFAQILAGSPYVDVDWLPQIDAAVRAQASRDAARAEFVSLFERARPLLEVR